MALFGQIQLQDYASPVFEATIWCNWPVIREGWAGIGRANSTGFFLNAGIILFREKIFFFQKKLTKKNVRFAAKNARFVANTCAL